RPRTTYDEGEHLLATSGSSSQNPDHPYVVNSDDPDRVSYRAAYCMLPRCLTMPLSSIIVRMALTVDGGRPLRLVSSSMCLEESSRSSSSIRSVGSAGRARTASTCSCTMPMSSSSRTSWAEVTHFAPRLSNSFVP